MSVKSSSCSQKTKIVYLFVTRFSKPEVVVLGPSTNKRDMLSENCQKDLCFHYIAGRNFHEKKFSGKIDFAMANFFSLRQIDRCQTSKGKYFGK